MNYLLIAITAYLLNAVSVTIDKILLVKKLPNPALYVFYISVFSLSALLLAPFTNFPNQSAFLISSASTILWTMGAYFMFRALKSGEAARVIPIIGTLIPVILLFMSALSGSVNLNEVWAVIILVLGLLFLIIPYLKGKFSREELLLELVSAFLFANSYFLLKSAYTNADFLSVFVYSKIILIPIILSILTLPFLRKKIFEHHSNQPKVNLYSKTGILLFAGQFAGGASQMLLTFAISLASPAVINSIQGIQYIFLFIISLVLAKKFPQAFGEKFTKLNITGKIIGILLIFLGLWILSFAEIKQKEPVFGVTFSSRYAQELGLNPDEVLDATLAELKPAVVRLPIYWDQVELEKGKYDFTATDNFMQRLNSTNTDVVLVVGYKQPRWPECFQPLWSKSEQDSNFNQSVLDLVKEEVTYFRKYPNIKYWQVENEPFLDFGICPNPNFERVEQEIAIVRSLDPRPILLTDSGELSSWFSIMELSDVFGTTLYRSVWNPWFGIVEYPWPPMFYTLKGQLIQFLSGSAQKPLIIAELQAEPWPAEEKSLGQISIADQQELFPNSQMKENIAYAKQTGFSEAYLWGVEWWYFMKINYDSSYWTLAQNILQKKDPTRF
jgi:drug/metabolite transporter (DMT)-like permease